MQTNLTKRDPAIDLVKIIAMVMVVCIHASSSVHTVGPYCLANYLNTLSRPAVPLFLMASGYILLARPVEEATLEYSLRKIWRIIRFTAIYTAVIYGLWYLFGDPPYSYLVSLKSIVGGCRIFYYLWFLLALAILYLLYPPVTRLWHKRHGSGILTAVALLMIIGGLALEIAYNYGKFVPYSLYLWTWLGYFILGGAMHKFVIFLRTSLAIMILAGAATVFSSIYLIEHLGLSPNYHTYGNPLLVIYTVSLFQACLDLKIGERGWLRMGAQLFLPVYVLHSAILNWLIDEFPWTLPGASLGLTLATLGITVALSWLLTRIPPLRRFFTL